MTASSMLCVTRLPSRLTGRLHILELEGEGAEPEFCCFELRVAFARRPEHITR